MARSSSTSSSSPSHYKSTQQPVPCLTTPSSSARDTWSRIGQSATILTPNATDRASFLAELSSPRLAQLSIIYRTFNSAQLTGNFDAELIAALPASVKFICHNGAGYDQIDVHACTDRGIRVSNTPTAVDDATADINIWLMLGALRGLPAGMASLRRGEWRSGVPFGHDPQGKVLGILGMGGIGRNMARKARAFGMKIRYHNRRKLSDELADGAEYVDLETLLKESDVLSLNLPLNVSFLFYFYFYYFLFRTIT